MDWLRTARVRCGKPARKARTRSGAWTSIKATAEEQRVLWLEVGVALMYGKLKANRPEGMKFSDWVQATFPGLGTAATTDAIWFAENSIVAIEMPGDMTHPQNIRQWHREQQAALGVTDPVLKDAPAPKTKTVLDGTTGKRIAKLQEISQGSAEICTKNVWPPPRVLAFPLPPGTPSAP